MKLVGLVGLVCLAPLFASLVACSPAALEQPTATAAVAKTSRTAYVVGGQVKGLQGIGLALRNARGEEVKVESDGTFAFGTPLDDGDAYAVTIMREPISPAQSCAIEHGAGKIARQPAMGITVVCTNVSFEDAPSTLEQHASN